MFNIDPPHPSLKQHRQSKNNQSEVQKILISYILKNFSQYLSTFIKNRVNVSGIEYINVLINFSQYLNKEEITRFVKFRSISELKEIFN